MKRSDNVSSRLSSSEFSNTKLLTIESYMQSQIETLNDMLTVNLSAKIRATVKNTLTPQNN